MNGVRFCFAICSGQLTWQFQFLLWRKGLVELLGFLFVHQIALGHGVFASHAVKVAGDEFLAEEEGIIRVGGEAVVAEAELSCEGEAALAVEGDVALKADGSAAE